MAIDSIFFRGAKKAHHPQNRLASGGEGDVYALSNSQAVKIYHNPDTINEEKLHLLCHLSTAGLLPQTAYGPQELVYDRSGRAIGFVMPKMPAEAIPLKSFCAPNFQKANHITPAVIFPLFDRILRDVQRFHRGGVIIGDFNDTNVFIDGRNFDAVFWVDIDSTQIGRFPCPVAHPAFFDPHLYHVTDLATQPAFTAASDRYAFLIHLAKALTGVHPYGGTHPKIKTLPDRATRHLSFFEPTVQLPPFAKNPHTLPDPLKKIFKAYFCRGQRPELPVDLFQLAAGASAVLTTGNLHPANQPTTAQKPINQALIKQLLGQERTLKSFNLLPGGRWEGLAYRPAQGDYAWLRGGAAAIAAEIPLFSGRPDLKIALWDEGVAVIDPKQGAVAVFSFDPTSRHVAPIFTAPLEKASPPHDHLLTAAVTNQALYRVAGGTLLRGTITNGQWSEALLATVHQRRSVVWGDPNSDWVAVLTSLWGEYSIWLRWPDGATTELSASQPLIDRWNLVTPAEMERYLKRPQSLITL